VITSAVAPRIDIHSHFIPPLSRQQAASLAMELEPGKLITESSHLAGSAKADLLYGNAARFFGLGA
jgi:hypothetical protein